MHGGITFAATCKVPASARESGAGCPGEQGVDNLGAQKPAQKDPEMDAHFLEKCDMILDRGFRLTEAARKSGDSNKPQRE